MRAYLLPVAPPLCSECRRRLSPRNGRRSAHRTCLEKRRRHVRVDWKREAEEELLQAETDRIEEALANASVFEMEEEEQNYEEYRSAQEYRYDAYEDLDELYWREELDKQEEEDRYYEQLHIEDHCSHYIIDECEPPKPKYPVRKPRFETEA